MKVADKMSRVTATLEKMFNNFNTDFFNGMLEQPIITVQSAKGTYGHSTNSKVWEKGEENAYEINIAQEVLKEPIEEIMDTMIHEMIHMYCRINGIKEISQRYHNNKFKELAEEKGLVCIKTKYGWNTIGKGNEKLIEYAIEKGWTEFQIKRNTMGKTKITTVATTTGTQETSGERRGNSIKYKCTIDGCKCIARTTKPTKLICGEHIKEMIVA